MDAYVRGSIAACVATVCTHPLDVAKVRAHCNVRSSGWYAGIHMALARQVVYSGTRFGIYDTCAPDTFMGRLGVSAGAGMVGACLSTPFDLLKVRSQAAYTHSGSVWTGVAPTILRAGVVTACQLTVFHQCRHHNVDALTSSFVAGCVTGVISNPVDVVKSLRMTGHEFPYIYRCVRRHPMILTRGLGYTLMRTCPYVTIMLCSHTLLSV